MENTANIEKRIKRHVLGKTMSFLVSTPLGMERVCVDELSKLNFSCPDQTIIKGGVEFKGRVHECYLANFKLRTSGRITMRIATFNSTNFRQLERNLLKIPWEFYLFRNALYEVHVTTHHSRLFHKGAIADHVKTDITDRFRQTGLGLESADEAFSHHQKIFIRSVDDHFTLSIDSSGDLLHKRGIKTHGGRAPIRETTAAAILMLAGYQKDEPLLDPMCGAGTFSLEAAMMANHIPAGWYRKFAFMGWPCFKPLRWSHIRKDAEKEMIRITEPVIFASDIDPTVCRSLKDCISQYDLSGTVFICQKDFFDLLPIDIAGQNRKNKSGLIVLNPPYGRRLETKEKSRGLFIEICKKLNKDFRGWKYALIASDTDLVRHLPGASCHDFVHGGLKLILLTGRI